MVASSTCVSMICVNYNNNRHTAVIVVMLALVVSYCVPSGSFKDGLKRSLSPKNRIVFNAGSSDHPPSNTWCWTRVKCILSIK